MYCIDLLSYVLIQELRLSSHVLSQFGSEGVQQPFDDVAFSTSWLKNLAAVTAPWLKSSRKSNITYTNDYDVFHYNAQPNPIPGSFLQLAGASYLLRATSWELYGRYLLLYILFKFTLLSNYLKAFVFKIYFV